MVLHATWNLSATLQLGVWFASYLFIMLPCALGVALVLLLALAREGRLLRQYLANELTPEDLNAVSSVGGRIAYSTRKFFQKGPKGWLASEQFLQVASELAFLRHGNTRGFSADPEEEQELHSRLHQLHAGLQ